MLCIVLRPNYLALSQPVLEYLPRLLRPTEDAPILHPRTRRTMGQAMSNPCCGRERFDKDAPCMPLRRITALQDARVHFINDSPMMCILRDSLSDAKSGESAGRRPRACRPALRTRILTPGTQAHTLSRMSTASRSFRSTGSSRARAGCFYREAR